MDEKKKIIEKTVEYIEKHLDGDLKLDDIADNAGYSKFHLNRVFSEVVGCTIHKYIQNRRLTKAAEKLVYTEDTIMDIAYDTKYESQQAFTLAFKQLYSLSPKVYRNIGIFSPKQNRFDLYSGAKIVNFDIFKHMNKCEVMAA